jgi:hypothetical protein
VALHPGHSRHQCQAALQDLEAGGSSHGRWPASAGTSEPGDRPGGRALGPGAGANCRGRARARPGTDPLCGHGSTSVTSCCA